MPVALRAEVFVVEQSCPFQDLDGVDRRDGVLHLLGYEGDHLAAYARIMAPGIGDDSGAAIGRVVTSPQSRGGGLGHSLLDEAVTACTARWPAHSIWLGAHDPAPPAPWLIAHLPGPARANDATPEAVTDLLQTAAERYRESPRMIANRAVQLQTMLAEEGLDEDAVSLLRLLARLPPANRVSFSADCQHYYNLRVQGLDREQALARLAAS